MSESTRPARVEAAIASLPTIATIVLSVAAGVWFLANLLGGMSSDMRLVQQQQAFIAEKLSEARAGQEHAMGQLASIGNRLERVESKVEELDDAVDEAVPVTRRTPSRGPSGRRYVTTSAGRALGSE